MIACSLCRSDNISDFVEIDKLPLLIFPGSKAIKDNIVAKRIKSFCCKDCGHIFTQPLSKEDTELIYTEYYRYYPYENLETMQATIRIPFENFLHETMAQMDNTSGKKLLEIGCSSGEPLKFFESYGYGCYGIDPSPLNTKSKSNILSGFYESYDFKEKFDVIVSRFNLEHVNDIHLFFNKTCEDLNDDGLLLIQVPNVKTYAESSMPLFLAHEHIQYFNEYSLWLLADQYNYSVINYDYKRSQTLIIALQKKQKLKHQIQVSKLAENFYPQYLESRKQLSNQVKPLIATHDDIIFYGAGLTLNWLLYELNFVQEIGESILFDDNPLVADMMMPLSNILVMPFDEERLHQSSAIFLTINPVYQKKMIDKLQDSNYQGKIYAIDQKRLLTIQ